MKPKRNNLLLLGVISLTLATPSAFAANLYWDTDGAIAGSGGATPSGNWDISGTTWSTDSTGATATAALTTSLVDDLFFSAGTDATGSYTVTLGTDQTAKSLIFEEGAATITGTTLTLAGGGGLTINAGAGNATISSSLTVNGNNIINVGSGSTLTLNTGTFSRGTGATVNIQGLGTGSSTMTNLSTNTNNIIGPWASVGTGATTIYAALNGTSLGALTYAASPSGSQGTSVTLSTNVVTGAGNLNYTLSVAGTLGASASVNTLRYTGAAGTLTSSTSFTTKGLMNVSGNLLTLAGTWTSGGSGTEMVINTANGNITSNAALTGTITKTGSGTFTFGTATGSSYGGVGAITVNQGIVSTSAIADNTIVGATINSGGTLQWRGNNKHRNDAVFTVNAGGTLDLNALTDTIGAIAGTGSITSATAATMTLSGGTQAFSGVIGGAVSLNLNLNPPSSALTLIGANTYNGTTTVSAGTLDLGGGTATGSLASPILTMAGGTLSYTRTGSTTQGFTTTNITGGANTISAVAGNTITLGNLTQAGGGTVNFGTTGTITTSRANDATGIIGGWATFGNTWAVANGAGMAISGLSSYTLTSDALQIGASYLNGNIDANNSAGLIDAAITANSLRFSTAAANTVTLATGPNTLSAGGILVGSAVGSNLSTITGGTLTGGASQNLAIIQNNTAGGLTISSSIVDNTLTSVTKSGAGLLTIEAANTYTGGTTINAGTVKLSGAGTLGLAAARVAVSSGALLDLNGTNQSITLAAGTGVGTVANNSGSGTSVLTLTATSAPDGGLLTIADSTSTPGGKVAVIITANTQTLSNLNTYSGGTTVNGGAFLYLLAATPSGAGTGVINLPVAGTGVPSNAGSGLVVDGVTYANDIKGAGYVHNNSNAGATAVTTTLTGNINTSGPFIFRGGTGISFNFAGNGTTSVLSGVIGSTTSQVNGAVATGSVIKSGTGTLTLSGANVYTGTTTISGGTLSASNIVVSGGNSHLGNATSAVTLGSAGAEGTLSYTGNTATYTRGFTIGGAGGGRLDVTTAGQTFTVGTGAITGSGLFTVGGAGNTSITANLTHTGGLTKTGNGTLTLSGSSNTYTGTTAVSGGTLVVNTIISTSTSLTVAPSATLGGIGTVGAATISGILAPGNGIGTLTAEGDVTWNANNAWAFGLGTPSVDLAAASSGSDNDLLRIAAGGDFLKGSGSAFTFDFANTGAVGVYKLVDWADTTDFAGNDFLATNLAGGLIGTFTVDGGTSALYLNVIPEPSTALLGGLGVLALLRRRRN